jgi:hypothetical protein
VLLLLHLPFPIETGEQETKELLLSNQSPQIAPMTKKENVGVYRSEGNLCTSRYFDRKNEKITAGAWVVCVVNVLLVMTI